MKAKSSPSSVTYMESVMDDSFAQWLQAKLLEQGIDANVYTSYIMGILASDDEDDHEDDETIALPHLNKYSGLLDCRDQLDQRLQSKLVLVQECLSGALDSADVEALTMELYMKIRERRKRLSMSSNSKYSALESISPPPIPPSTARPIEPLFYQSTMPSTSQDTFVPDQPLGFSLKENNSWSFSSQSSSGLPVSSEDSFQRLAKKFNDDIASIWSVGQDMKGHPELSVQTPDDGSSFSCSSLLLTLDDPSRPSTNGPRGSTGNIWTFSPRKSFNATHGPSDNSSTSSDVSSPDGSSSSDKSRQSTSLKNHTEDSLFVPVYSARSSLDGSSSSAQRKLSFDLMSKSLPESSDRNENLLTSTKTHFQPIRQDYYERDVGHVLDTHQTGLVPCSGKCPNHLRNRSSKCLSDERPASTSREELSLFVGPFPEEDTEVDHLEIAHDVLQRELPSSQSDSVDPIQDDYEDICHIVNQVLNHQTPTEEEPEVVDVTEDPVASFHFGKQFIPAPRVEEELVYEEAGAQGDNFYQDWDPSEYPCEDGYDMSSFAGHAHWSTASDDRDNSVSPLTSFNYDPRADRGQLHFKKPCAFFLEGNCRKSDCKFSHDLSNITCKYWMEGFCFKGDLCPFLHDIVGESFADHDTNMDKTEKTRFIIDSEQDFPTLGVDKKNRKKGYKSGPNAHLISTSLSSNSSSSTTSAVTNKRSSPKQVNFRNQVGRGRKSKKKGGHQKAL